MPASPIRTSPTLSASARRRSLIISQPRKISAAPSSSARGWSRLTDGRGRIAEDAEQAKRQFDRFLRFFERLTEDGSRFCMGGRLSAYFAVLPDQVRDPFRAFMAEHGAWLEELCRVGQKTGAFRKDMPAKEQALMLRAAVQGAVQLARSSGDPELCVPPAAIPDDYWRLGRPFEPSRYARSAEAAERLWRLSEALCGARFL